jgi:ubiquinone/menaquinone biosynthesis C-methylase UbiE
MNGEHGTEASRLQYGKVAAHYATSPSHAGGADLARLIDLLQLNGSESVLDVATGTGHTALALAPHVAAVTGLDPTPEMLAEAGKLATQRGIANVHFMLGQAERLPCADGSFDVVTVRRAPHHFQNIPVALGEMHRVLRPGGKLGLIDQLTAHDPEAVELMERFERRRDPSHVRALSVDEWRQTLAAAGFTVQHVEVDEERQTLDDYLDRAGTAPADRDGIVAMLRAAEPLASRGFGYTSDPPPEGSFLKERIISLATRA